MLQLGTLFVNAIAKASYIGLFLLAAGESCLLPIPSEIILPFAGYLVFKGQMTFLLAVLTATLGQLAGSMLAYIIGYKVGRPFVQKYGRYFLLSKSKFEKVENWFVKYGHVTVFISRLLPVFRTIISLPAGTAKMPFKKFLIYSAAGILPWTLLLVYAGFILGEAWDSLIILFNKFQYIIIIIALLVFVWLFWKAKHEK
ncbi:MAG: DedA family protein [Candidatus Nanoarchaeia archaeon]